MDGDGRPQRESAQLGRGLSAAPPIPQGDQQQHEAGHDQEAHEKAKVSHRCLLWTRRKTPGCGSNVAPM